MCVTQAGGVCCGDDLSLMMCLPDELLLAIFTYLQHIDVASCAAVCHKFKRVAMDATLCQLLNPLTPTVATWVQP